MWRAKARRRWSPGFIGHRCTTGSAWLRLFSRISPSGPIFTGLGSPRQGAGSRWRDKFLSAVLTMPQGTSNIAWDFQTCPSSWKGPTGHTVGQMSVHCRLAGHQVTVSARGAGSPPKPVTQGLSFHRFFRKGAPRCFWAVSGGSNETHATLKLLRPKESCSEVLRL